MLNLVENILVVFTDYGAMASLIARDGGLEVIFLNHLTWFLEPLVVGDKS